jgi:hypothetical protein
MAEGRAKLWHLALASVNFYVRDELDGAITVDQVIYVTIDGGTTWSPLTTT